MAAAALRFLAHCFEMTLLVSLSTSAGRGRRSLSFLFPAPRLFLSLSVQCGSSSVFSLSHHPLAASLSFHVSLSEQRAPTSLLPWSCWSGGWELKKDRGREGGRQGRKEEGRNGEQIVCQAREGAVEFCRLPRRASRQRIEPLSCRMHEPFLCPSPATQRRKTGESVLVLCICLPGPASFPYCCYARQAFPSSRALQQWKTYHQKFTIAYETMGA